MLRATFGLWILGAATGLTLYLVYDALAAGAVLFTLASLPWLLLVLWVIYVLTVRPCLIVRRNELVIVNVGREHHLPWSTIADLTSRYQLAVVLHDGRRIVSWGAPSLGVDRASVWGAGRPADPPRAQGVRPSRTPRAQLPVTSIIDSARARWEDDAGGEHPDASEPARSGWDWFVVLGTVVIGLCCLASALLAGGAA